MIFCHLSIKLWNERKKEEKLCLCYNLIIKWYPDHPTLGANKSFLIRKKNCAFNKRGNKFNVIIALNQWNILHFYLFSYGFDNEILKSVICAFELLLYEFPSWFFHLSVWVTTAWICWRIFPTFSVDFPLHSSNRSDITTLTPWLDLSIE